MQTLAEIRKLLDERGLSPRKSFGQNFLIDHNLIRKLVDASGVRAGDTVLEIGPGTGTMTEELLWRGCGVIACELDRGLAALLRDRFPTEPRPSGSGLRKTPIEETRQNFATTAREKEETEVKIERAEPPPDGRGSGRSRFTLIEGDCLENKRTLNPEIVRAIRGRPFRLVANLPYGAATPLLTTLVLDHPTCVSMWVTVQREVAERIAATPGGKEYGLLSVLAQAACTVHPIATLPPECFWPRPDVTSAMIGLVRRSTPLTDDLPALAAVCQAVFGQRRKQIGSILGRDLAWPTGVQPTLRAEQLTVEQLIALARVPGLPERIR